MALHEQKTDTGRTDLIRLMQASPFAFFILLPIAFSRLFSRSTPVKANDVHSEPPMPPNGAVMHHGSQH